MAFRHPRANEMDEAPRQSSDNHHRQVRRLERDHREQGVPEDRGLPGRVVERVPRHARYRGVGYREVGPGGALTDESQLKPRRAKKYPED